MPDELDFAYAAGIIDGEGYIGITTQERAGKMQTPAFQAVVNVGMVDLEVVPEAEIARKREYAQSLRDMNQRLKKCA